MSSQVLNIFILIQILSCAISLIVLGYKIVERIKEKPKDDDELNNYKNY